MFRRSILFSGLAVALVLSAGFLLAQRSAAVDAVRVPLELYMQAHASGDGSYIRRAFHPNATVSWIHGHEGIKHETREEFAARFRGGPAHNESERKRRIAFVDVHGDVAVARLELNYPDADIISYMSLLREDDAWTILHKGYTRTKTAPR